MRMKKGRPDWELEKLLSEAEDAIADALQKFPENDFILTSQARLSELLSEKSEAKGALERAFNTNPRNAHVARTLSRYYREAGDAEMAEDVLCKAIDARPNERSLHYAVARLMMERDAKPEEILHHLKKSYSEGDSNYDAQLLHGRQLFVMGDTRGAKDVFKKTVSVP